jgi:hypothetical protein
MQLRAGIANQQAALGVDELNIQKQLREQGLEINRANIERGLIIDSWRMNHKESRWDDMKELQEDERESLSELKELEQDFLINMGNIDDERYTRREYLRARLQRDLKEEDWKRIDRKFQAEENRWAKKFGLEEDLVRIRETNTLLQGLSYLSEEAGSDIGAGPFGTGIEGSSINILSNPALLKLYAEGELDERNTALINAAIANTSRPRRAGTNESGDPVYARGTFYALPEAFQAYRRRSDLGLSVPDLNEFGESPLN